MRMGGEFRHAQVDEFYHRHAIGSYSFLGSEGPNGDGQGALGDRDGLRAGVVHARGIARPEEHLPGRRHPSLSQFAPREVFKRDFADTIQNRTITVFSFQPISSK